MTVDTDGADQPFTPDRAHALLGPATVEDVPAATVSTAAARWFLTEQDAQGVISRCDGTPESILGRTCAEMLGRTARDHMTDDDSRRLLDVWMQVIGEPGATRTTSVALQHLDGSSCWCDVLLTNRLDDPAVGAVVVMVVDVEDHRRTEATVRASERRFRALAEQMPVAVFLSEPGGSITYANRRFQAMLGAAQSVGEISPTLLSRWSEVSSAATSSLTFQRDGRHLEIVVSTPSATLHELGDDDASFGVDDVIVASVMDVTEAHNQVRDLQTMAETDALTGLANRRALERQLGALLADGQAVVVAMIDLDGFKACNDHLGHRAGDQVLVDTAQRLNAVLAGEHIAARVGGDEFVVVASDDDPQATEQLLERLGHLLDTPLHAGATRRVTASLGWARSEPGDQPGDVLDRADAAMYAYKRERARRSHPI